MGFSQVFLLGALSEEPKVRHSSLTITTMELKVAGEEMVRHRMLFWKHRVIVSGPQVERLQKVLKKGQVLFVEGALEVWITGGQGGGSSSNNEGASKPLEVVRAKRIYPIRRAEGEILFDELGRAHLRPGSNRAFLVGRVIRVPIVKEAHSGDLLTILGVETRVAGKVHHLDLLAWGDLGKRASGFRVGDGVWAAGFLVNRLWKNNRGDKWRRSRVEAFRLEQLALVEEEMAEPLEVGVV